MTIQLQMVWPKNLLTTPPPIHLPTDYQIRPFQSGDEPRFYEVMALAGWTDWDAERLAPWLPRIPADGWFMAVHKPSNLIVATAMALTSDAYEEGGEIGWVAADPAHTGKGLGKAISSAVTARLIETRCTTIHLYTEDWRLAALKIYLTLGYIPFIYSPEAQVLWEAVCTQLEIPFAKQLWEAKIAESPPKLIQYN